MPVRATRRLIMQKARGHQRPARRQGQAPTACRRTVSGSFHPGIPGTFHLSLTVLFTIGLSRVFSLTGWCRQFQTGFLRPRPTQDTRPDQPLTATGLSPPTVGFPKPFAFAVGPLCRSYNPERAVTPSVWAVPPSLATTSGITLVFSSSRYLDVSVPRVCLAQYKPGDLLAEGLPHSDIRGSICPDQSPRLFAARHVLHRLREPRHPPCALVCFLSVRIAAACFPSVKELCQPPSR